MLGYKNKETRTWNIKYRGDLLICAAKRPHNGNVLLPGIMMGKGAKVSTPLECSKALDAFPELAIFGVALCVVNVVGCSLMRYADQQDACCFWYPGAYCWQLEDVRPVEQVQIKGSQGFFSVDDSLIKFL